MYSTYLHVSQLSIHRSTYMVCIYELLKTYIGIRYLEEEENGEGIHSDTFNRLHILVQCADRGEGEGEGAILHYHHHLTCSRSHMMRGT